MPTHGRQESGSRARMIKVVTADELVMERFRLIERIGSGGMGTVYRAFDERLQRAVAVKEIQTADAARVLREAQAAARLNHPSIVTLYELGEHDGSAILSPSWCPARRLPRWHRGGALSTATSPRSPPTSATRSPTPTRAASSTATSSRRT